MLRGDCDKTYSPGKRTVLCNLLGSQLETVRPWWTRLRPTARYLMETEAHVYALAVAASVLLAFYPFLMVMLSFCRDVLRWPAAVQKQPLTHAKRTRQPERGQGYERG